MKLSIASYNILANAYIKAEYYPRTNPAYLAKKWRMPALVERILGLDADVVCLQEVAKGFKIPGYSGVFAKKKRFKPDGLAIFVRGDKPPLHEAHYFTDSSGHLVLTAEYRGVGIATTHLKWGVTGEASAEQMRQLLAKLDRRQPWILCGDLNVTPGSEALRMAMARGFSDHGSAFTANPNGKAKRIDYILGEMPCIHRPVRAIDDLTPLPDAGDPSDHLPIVADAEY